MYIKDPDFDKLLKETAFVVEADSFAVLELWAKYSDDTETRTKYGHFNDIKWEQVNPGCLKTIGHVNKRPVCLSLNWNLLNNHFVLFWNATSELVDHKMIDEWFEKHCHPTYEHGRSASCDAMNFHHVYHFVKETNALSQKLSRGS